MKLNQRVRLVEKTDRVGINEIGRVSKLLKGGVVVVNFPDALVTAALEDLICHECDRAY